MVYIAQFASNSALDKVFGMPTLCLNKYINVLMQNSNKVGAATNYKHCLTYALPFPAMLSLLVRSILVNLASMTFPAKFPVYVSNLIQILLLHKRATV